MALIDNYVCGQKNTMGWALWPCFNKELTHLIKLDLSRCTITLNTMGLLTFLNTCISAFLDQSQSVQHCRLVSFVPNPTTFDHIEQYLASQAVPMWTSCYLTVTKFYILGKTPGNGILAFNTILSELSIWVRKYLYRLGIP